MNLRLILIPFLSSSLSFAQNDAPVVKLRETIAQIVDVKAQGSKEWTDWQEQKETMAELLKVHQKELALLEEELNKSGNSAGGFDEKKRDAEKELDRLRQARRVANVAVARNRDRMLALTKQFPTPLAEEVEPEIITLEEWETGGEAREGIQALLGLVTKAEQFNRRITRAKEVRNGREVEVIYLGLARAYYTNRDDSSGSGTPGPEGWQWTENAELRGEIVKALDELDRKRPPELVELPVKIQD